MRSASPKTIAVVTGASRGAGRGIATALGSHGCTVYVTGRSEKPGDGPLPGTIHETAADVTAAGSRYPTATRTKWNRECSTRMSSASDEVDRPHNSPLVT